MAIAFTLHASAYLGEIWRGSIDAVPHGQVEAAKALGLDYVSRMKDVILPQAIEFRCPLPSGFLFSSSRVRRLPPSSASPNSPGLEALSRTRFTSLLLVFGVVGAIYFAFVGRCRFMARGWNTNLLRPPR